MDEYVSGGGFSFQCWVCCSFGESLDGVHFWVKNAHLGDEGKGPVGVWAFTSTVSYEDCYRARPGGLTGDNTL